MTESSESQVDVGLLVLAYLDRCERVGKQGTFSELVQFLRAEGASAEEAFHGIRWLFGGDYAIRTRPNEFDLTEEGRQVVEDFRLANATLH